MHIYIYIYIYICVVYIYIYTYKYIAYNHACNIIGYDRDMIERRKFSFWRTGTRLRVWLSPCAKRGVGGEMIIMIIIILMIIMT